MGLPQNVEVGNIYKQAHRICPHPLSQARPHAQARTQAHERGQAGTRGQAHDWSAAT